MSIFKTTDPGARNYVVALWAGFLGGNLSSFVKWGLKTLCLHEQRTALFLRQKCCRIWDSMLMIYFIIILDMWLTGASQAFTIFSP